MSDRIGDAEDKCDEFLREVDEERVRQKIYCLSALERRRYEFRSKGDVKMELMTMRRRRRKRKKEEEKERRKHISTRERRDIFILFRAILSSFQSASFEERRIREKNSIRQGREERRDPAWLQRQGEAEKRNQR